MLRRAELAKAADSGVAALVGLLKRPAVETLNGPLRIVAVQAAGAIAGQRAALIGRVLPCLLALADVSGGSAVRVACSVPDKCCMDVLAA